MKKSIPIKRWNTLKKVIDGELTIKEAGLQMGLSYRQVIRMKQSVLQDGIRGLIHGNTGRRPVNAVDDKVKQKILEWSRNAYGRINDACFAEILEKEKGIKVSRETIRKIRRSGGILPGKARRQPRHTAESDRPREGLNIFWDGMIHQWFTQEPYACCLVAVIDDASGRCLAAHFFPFEESFAYLWVLKTVVVQYGIPEKIIQDRNPLLMRSGNEWSIEEELRGEQDPTQVGSALRDLGIEPVYVRTKRQQRYFERIFELFHVCLLEALQNQHISDIQAGNAFLEACFIHSFNRDYAIQAETMEQRWRQPEAPLDIERICSFRYEAQIGSNGMVQVGDLSMLLKADIRLRTGQSRVDVRQLLDGSWRLYAEDVVIGEHPPTPLREPVRMKVKPQRKTTRAASCAWTYSE